MVWFEKRPIQRQRKWMRKQDLNIFNKIGGEKLLNSVFCRVARKSRCGGIINQILEAKSWAIVTPKKGKVQLKWSSICFEEVRRKKRG